MTKPADRIERHEFDDGTTETRVYRDGRLVEKRHTPPLDANPYAWSAAGWLPEEAV